MVAQDRRPPGLIGARERRRSRARSCSTALGALQHAAVDRDAELAASAPSTYCSITPRSSSWLELFGRASSRRGSAAIVGRGRVGRDLEDEPPSSGDRGGPALPAGSANTAATTLGGEAAAAGALDVRWPIFTSAPAACARLASSAPASICLTRSAALAPPAPWRSRRRARLSRPCPSPRRTGGRAPGRPW